MTILTIASPTLEKPDSTGFLIRYTVARIVCCSDRPLRESTVRSAVGQAAILSESDTWFTLRTCTSWVASSQYLNTTGMLEPISLHCEIPIIGNLCPVVSYHHGLAKIFSKLCYCLRVFLPILLFPFFPFREVRSALGSEILPAYSHSLSPLSFSSVFFPINLLYF